MIFITIHNVTFKDISERKGWIVFVFKSYHLYRQSVTLYNTNTHVVNYSFNRFSSKRIVRVEDVLQFLTTLMCMVYKRIQVRKRLILWIIHIIFIANITTLYYKERGIQSSTVERLPLFLCIFTYVHTY